jgi:hypothetical protein
MAARNLVPLVHVPPRGLWGRSGPVQVTTAAAWLGRELPAAADPPTAIARYLAAFGPATVADMQTWSGLTGLRAVVTGMAPRLRTFRDERGRELVDLPEAPRPDPDTPAPVRLLAEYDNAILSHADRTRIVTDEHRRALQTSNGVVRGTVLVDGFVAASWQVVRDRGRATAVITPLRRLPARDRSAVAAEAAGLLAFTAAGADHDVRFDEPGAGPTAPG